VNLQMRYFSCFFLGICLESWQGFAAS
jgi:hypothetical protein